MGSVLTNIILIIILLALVGGAVLYMYKQKKKGVHCIGCPYGASCPKSGSAKCNCTNQKASSR